MNYHWLVIWWIVSVTMTPTDPVYSDWINENTIPSRKITFPTSEKIKRVEMNFAVFKTKPEAEKFTKTGQYGYTGNIKLKYQIVELKPEIETQREDASPEQKELLKGE